MRAGIFLTSHRGWGIVRSMSLSFAFIIPLNYGIITKNNLNLRREQGGHGHLYPARREDNMLLLPEVLDHRRFSPIFADFGVTFA